MVKYYNSGYYLDGDPIYHTEETCSDARRVRKTQPEERTIQAGMQMCEACRRIAEARQSGKRHCNQ